MVLSAQRILRFVFHFALSFNGLLAYLRIKLNEMGAGMPPALTHYHFISGSIFS